MNMRQKKSNLAWYIIGLAVLAAVVFVVMHEVPREVEHVEQDIPVSVK